MREFLGRHLCVDVCSLATVGGLAISTTWPQPHIMLGTSVVMPQSPLEWVSLHGVCRIVAAMLGTRWLLGYQERPLGDAAPMVYPGLKDCKMFSCSMSLPIHGAPLAPLLTFYSPLVSPESIIFTCYFTQKESTPSKMAIWSAAYDYTYYRIWSSIHLNHFYSSYRVQSLLSLKRASWKVMA